MNKKGLGLNGFVILFVGIIFALAFLPVIFNAQASMTQKTPVTNEAISIAPARINAGSINTTYPFTVTHANTVGEWQYTECPLASVVYGNTSANYALTTDYLFNATTGVLTLKNTTTVLNSGNNATVIDYTYCQDGYAKDSGARTVASLIGLFAVLILLAFVLDKSGVIELDSMFR